MAELVISLAEIIANVETLHRYRLLGPRERRFHDRRIKNGKVFVAIRRREQIIFSPSKFAGYRHNDLSHERELDQRDGGATNGRIERLVGAAIDQRSEAFQEVDEAFLAYCLMYGIVPSRHPRVRSYWLIDIDDAPLLPEEVPEGALSEGAVEVIQVNRYERSTEARRDCIAYYGYNCIVCSESLDERYGELAKDFIHVHHLTPLSQIGREYIIDPVRDLRPVCPNCHAMLHRRREILSIEELQAIVRRRRT